MKKIASLIGVLFMAMVVFTAYCGSGGEKKDEQKRPLGQATVTMDTIVARAGDSLDVAVSLENDIAIGGMQLKIGFDAGVLAFGKPTLTKRSAELIVMNNTKNNELMLMVYSMGGKSISPGKGPIIMLPVKVAAQASGVYGLDLREVIVATHDARSVPATWAPGALNVKRR